MSKVSGAKLFETLEDVSCEFRHVTGQLRRRQLYKQVISRVSGWVVILFVWQDYRTRGKFGKRPPGWQEPRFAIERWYFVGERWRQEARISLRPSDALSLAPLLAGLDLQALSDEADRQAETEDPPPDGSEDLELAGLGL